MANPDTNCKKFLTPVTSYVSCIRIHGLRILPPILTEEKRNQMNYYKELAIKIEEKIKSKKIKKISNDSTDLSDVFIESDTSSISDSVIYSSDKSSIDEPTYKSQIFSDGCNKDVLKLLKDNTSIKPRVTELPLIDQISNVPLRSSDESDKNKCLLNKLDLPCNDTNKYSDDITEKFHEKEISSISYEVNMNKESGNDYNNILNNNTSSHDKNESSKNNSDIINEKLSPPTLIRSNSYILETPSPVLLALMKQQNQQCSLDKTNDCSSRKRRSWDLVHAREKWSSIEHDLNVVADRTSGSKRNENFTFISLPPSPDNKMFKSNLENIRRSESQNLQPERESEIPTPEKPKQLKTKRIYSAPKMTETLNSNTRFIKSFATPLRTQNKYNEIERDYLEKTEQKPKKTIEYPVKKTDLNLNKQVASQLTSSQMKAAGSIILPKKPDIISSGTSEKQIREIIEKIHNEQSKQMAELITRQQKEQENLMKTFAEQQAALLSKLRNTYQNPSTRNIKTNDETNHKINNHANEPIQENIKNGLESDILKNSESLLFECKRLLHENTNSDDNSSQTLYTTALSSPDDVTITNFSMKSDHNDNLSPSYRTDIFPSKEDSICPSSASARHSNSFSVDSLEPPCNSNFNRSNDRIRNSSCSRQLFPSKKQVWAATKINALVRGYLVRRLIKTERVQNLIKTIKDTLVCAMELHHETADNIQPADVELHRRLIQQVTAACYSFHDTFFELSRSDQLSIIATDRERQKEKLLRPTSAKSNSALSSTTQRVLERKMRRKSTDSTSGAPSRSSSSRSCYSAGEFRIRTKSLGLSDSVSSSRKTSPQNDVMRRAMSYGANKKPWR